MAEGHRPAAGRGAATGTVRAQAAFHRAHQDLQDGTLQGRVVLQEIAQPLGYGEHPLPQRQRRQDVIGQMRGRFHHAPRVARRAHTAAFTGKADQEVMATRRTKSAGKAMREDATFEIAGMDTGS